MPKNKIWTGIAVLLAGLVILLLWRSGSPQEPRASGTSASSAGQAEAKQPSAEPQPAAAEPAGAPAADRRTTTAPKQRGKRPVSPEVERLRARVIGALASRPHAAVEKQPGADRATPPAHKEYGPGNIKDRTGELTPETMKVLNNELSPLIDECYDQAHERNADLKGMLAINIDLAGAEELGTIIESVEAVAGLNQLDDDELIECVRQSAYSLRLPQPLESGRLSRQFTGRFGMSE